MLYRIRKCAKSSEKLHVNILKKKRKKNKPYMWIKHRLFFCNITINLAVVMATRHLRAYKADNV